MLPKIYYAEGMTIVKPRDGYKVLIITAIDESTCAVWIPVRDPDHARHIDISRWYGMTGEQMEAYDPVHTFYFDENKDPYFTDLERCRKLEERMITAMTNAYREERTEAESKLFWKVKKWYDSGNGWNYAGSAIFPTREKANEYALAYNETSYALGIEAYTEVFPC